MTTPATQTPLRIRQSPKRQLHSTGIIALFLCAYILTGTTGMIPEVIMWSGIIVFGTVLLLGLHNTLKAARASWELTLDHDGITVRGHPRVPWTDIAEVRLVDARPRWLFLPRKSYQSVAFLGRPGVALPSLPSARGHADTSRAGRARHVLYGTQLVLPPKLFDATTETILTAVEHHGHVPTTRT